MDPKRKDQAPPICHVATLEELLRVLMGEPSPLLRVIAHSMVNAGNPGDTEKSIFERLLDTPLRELVSRIAEYYTDFYARRAHVAQDVATRATSHLTSLRGELANSLGEVADGNLGRVYPGLANRIIGETKLREYDRVSPEMWVEDLEQACLVTRAREGDHHAFGTLYGACERKVERLVHAWILNEQEARTKIDDTKSTVWEKLATFDPSRASFSGFVLYQAKILVKYRKGRRQEIPFSQLQNSSQEDESEEVEFADPNAVPASEVVIGREECAELFDRAFGGSGPPHQVLVHGYTQLLQWMPSDVMRELANVTLGEVAARLEREFLDRGMRVEWIGTYFERLRCRMEEPLGRVVADPNTLKIYPELLDQIVNRTTLRDYYMCTCLRGLEEVIGLQTIRSTHRESLEILPHQPVILALVKRFLSEIVSQCWHTPLRHFAAQLGEAFPHDPSIKKLGDVLDQRVGDIIPAKAEKARRKYERLLAQVVGDTAPTDWFPSFEAKVTQWWESVGRRMWTQVERDGEGPLYERTKE
jgi:DNA-directed RNA polymerase specialized sigma24 family protein